MGDDSDDTRLSPLQQTSQSDFEQNEAPGLTVENNNHADGIHHRRNLREALMYCQLNRIDEIFRNSPSLVNTPWIEPDRETPLHYACRFAFNDVAKHLLDREDIKGSLDQVDSHGLLPLQHAIRARCQNSVILTMIDKTSPIGLTSKTKDGDTLIHLASRSGLVLVLDRLCTLQPKGMIDIDSTNMAGSTAIHEGIEDWNVVSCLLRHGASRFTDEHGNTLFHAAVAPGIINRHRGMETRRKLLERGDDLGAENEDKDTPFHLVARNLNSESDTTGMALTVLQELLHLREGEPPHERAESLVGALEKFNAVGDTVLHIIASNRIDGGGDDGGTKSSKQRQAENAVNDILKLCPDMLTLQNREGDSPLHRACFLDNSRMVDVLLEADKGRGSEAKHIAKLQNEEGNTPLHLAVCSGHRPTVKKLVAAVQSDGAILIRNNQDQTPLHVATAHGECDILKELLTGWASYEDVLVADPEHKLRDGKGMTPLHIAAGKGTEGKVTELVGEILSRCTGTDLLNEVQPSTGRTALHFAASRGNERVVELLLLNGTDSSKTDIDNLVAADVALRANRVDIAGLIRQYRSRSFRLELEFSEENAKTDDYFLALNWPKWDKAVRQQHGEPPRMWPQVISVYQLIFKANDTYCKARRRRRRGNEASGSPRIRDTLEVIDLAPIHQAQIRVSSCNSDGWIMEERREFKRIQPLEKKMHQHRQNERGAIQAYIYDSGPIQNEKRSTRWIHFPANNVRTNLNLQIFRPVY